jgi:lipopolysaccharide/colanic/teichoic acid biosynthesis glycosyltransferase
MGLITALKEYSKPKQKDVALLFEDRAERIDLGFIKKNIVKEVGQDVYTFLAKHVNLADKNSFITATSTRFNINNLPYENYRQIINLKNINDARYVNKFFEAINAKLTLGGIYINSVETYATRRHRVLGKFTRPFNWFYYIADVVFMRVFPKLPVTKKIYFFITKGRNRILTRAEAFGRLYSCGFEIIDEAEINDKLYFVARKVKTPVFDNDPSYGPLVRLKRIGKGGKIFNVYKLRTMHAYAEYLQEYVHKHNDLKEGGKFNNDFRITTEGRFFRKFWLDELPMLINLLKGEMKLVGVRPLSTHYFSLYSKELQEKRIQHKPGLVPPYYADMPKNLDEIMASEMRYLEACEKHPFRTDIKYFFKAFYNIFIKGARSG